jgi:uridine kinase
LINEDEDIKNITKLLNPVSTLIEDNIKYDKNKHINDIINQWSKLYKLNELKKINETLSEKKYDLVIRYRPDVFLETVVKKENLLGLEKIIIPFDSKIDKSKLSNTDDEYVCDAIAFGSSEMMDKYFDIFKNIKNLISNYGYVSETILKKNLNNNSIKYELQDINYNFILSKCNVFAICGDSGSGKSTLSNILKNSFFDSFTLECDRYHKWERHNENWKNLTHLNPDANYITKMNNDIFDLKLGREIYQVDYNHESGKFTEKQLINPANNLIVCGLHSLYDKNSTFVYDLKIFMDTDENLKMKWKIKRDIKERGYTVDKILDSIKKRKTDFDNYILPQKENADIIIRFFTDDVIDFNNLETKELIKLDLSISKNFNITNILNNFNLLNIKYDICDSDENFRKIRFSEYQQINLFNYETILTTNTYYDYILYFILNLIITN